MDDSSDQLANHDCAPLTRAISRPLDQNPALVFIRRLSAGSRRTMQQSLDVIARTLTSGKATADSLRWESIRYQHVAALREGLSDEGYSPATVNKILSALRGVLKEAWRLGIMSGDALQRACDVAGIKSSTLPAGRGLPQGELRAIFMVCSADLKPAGARDAALLAILYGAGLRRSEAVALNLADFNRDDGGLTIRSGKGRKDRITYVSNGSRDALADWCTVRGAAEGALLCPVNRGGRIKIRRMTDQAVVYILRKRAKEAGVARFSPHDLRRSFVGDLLDAGADISTVQRLAGHASVTTTQRYDRRGEGTKRKAVDLLLVPYISPRR